MLSVGGGVGMMGVCGEAFSAGFGADGGALGCEQALGGASMERLGLPATTAAMLRLVVPPSSRFRHSFAMSSAELGQLSASGLK